MARTQRIGPSELTLFESAALDYVLVYETTSGKLGIDGRTFAKALHWTPPSPHSKYSLGDLGASSLTRLESKGYLNRKAGRFTLSPLGVSHLLLALSSDPDPYQTYLHRGRHYDH
jgi:hypothetical protein